MPLKPAYKRLDHTRQATREVPAPLFERFQSHGILLSYELFGGDHQLVQVVHDAESRADSDVVVP